MKNRNSLYNILKWTARGISLFFIITLLLVGIGSIFESGPPPSEAWFGLLFMPIGFIIGLIIAWKWEGLGGLMALLSLIGFQLFLLLQYGNFSSLFPLLTGIPAILFLLYWFLTKKKN